MNEIVHEAPVNNILESTDNKVMIEGGFGRVRTATETSL